MDGVWFLRRIEHLRSVPARWHVVVILLQPTCPVLAPTITLVSDNPNPWNTEAWMPNLQIQIHHRPQIGTNHGNPSAWSSRKISRQGNCTQIKIHGWHFEVRIRSHDGKWMRCIYWFVLGYNFLHGPIKVICIDVYTCLFLSILVLFKPPCRSCFFLSCLACFIHAQGLLVLRCRVFFQVPRSLVRSPDCNVNHEVMQPVGVCWVCWVHW